MKKFIITTLLTGCALFTCHAQQRTLTILHTNDTHSTILPLNKNLADTVVADRGGYLRRIALLKEERAQDPELLLFDSGDFSQGSAFYSMFEGDVEIGLMNQMHYDAVTIGNHEFDFGLDNMIRIFKKATFPIVCSNYDFANTELKDMYEALMAGDPKMRTLRALYVKIFGRYMGESKEAQGLGGKRWKTS